MDTNSADAIINAALRLAAIDVVNLADTNEITRKAESLYDFSLIELLSAKAWRFAYREASLYANLIPDTEKFENINRNYKYKYSIPYDVITELDIVNQENRTIRGVVRNGEKPPFNYADGDILSDDPVLIYCYIRHETDLSKFPQSLKLLLRCKLAENIARSFEGNVNVQFQTARMYSDLMDRIAPNEIINRGVVKIIS